MQEKTKLLQVRVTDEEKKQLLRVADSYGMNMSEFMRTMTSWIERHQPRLIIEPRKKEEEHVR